MTSGVKADSKVPGCEGVFHHGLRSQSLKLLTAHFLRWELFIANLTLRLPDFRVFPRIFSSEFLRYFGYSHHFIHLGNLTPIHRWISGDRAHVFFLLMDTVVNTIPILKGWNTADAY